jgi:tetratricopeptide (TPR) repeat protein
MGRKRTRARKFIYFCLAGLIFFSWSACTTSKRQASSREEEHAAAAQPQAQERSPAWDHLQRARELLGQADYEGSLKENQKALDAAKEDPPGDEALFNMGMIYAHFGNPKKDYEKSLLFFQRLMKKYPQSPWVEEAKVLTAVLRENRKLQEDIEKAKQVDIDVERKKKETEK